MTTLHAWLQRSPASARTLRVAVSLLLALVLVAGGPACGAGAPTAGATTAVATDAAIGGAVESPRPLVRADAGAAAVTAPMAGRVPPRWRDLRSGGLAAARAPDATAAPQRRS